nr:hypothetical protein CFP56_67784 [Quercus suber]
MVTWRAAGSTYETSYTIDVSLPKNVFIHDGIACRQVISRSVRRMCVCGSSERESVSTAMTCVDLSFHGQYFRQLQVLTSSHEYANSCAEEKKRMALRYGGRGGRGPWVRKGSVLSVLFHNRVSEKVISMVSSFVKGGWRGYILPRRQFQKKYKFSDRARVESGCLGKVAHSTLDITWHVGGDVAGR